jgi:hypothetical protein
MRSWCGVSTAIATEPGADLVEITQALIARNGYHASSISEASQDEADNAPQSLLDRRAGIPHCPRTASR